MFPDDTPLDGPADEPLGHEALLPEPWSPEAWSPEPWSPATGSENVFSAEIANVDASDWDLDADLIWGEDWADDAPPALDGGAAFDLPL